MPANAKMFQCAIKYNGTLKLIHARIAGEGLAEVLRYLSTLECAGKDFLPRLSEAMRGRVRNHLARRAEGVYFHRKSWDDQVIEMVPGWYLGLNISNNEKEKFIEKACKIVGLNYGKQVLVKYIMLDRDQISAIMSVDWEFCAD